MPTPDVPVLVVLTPGELIALDTSRDVDLAAIATILASQVRRT